MAASVALASGAGCPVQPPPEPIVPFVRGPEEVIPGRPLFYATTLVQDGCGVGVLAESHEGRPTKLEPNELHPASVGGTSAITQAAVLDLYDPDRSRVVLYRGAPSSVPRFLEIVGAQLERVAAHQGEGLRVLSGAVASPTFAATLRGVLERRYPRARWVAWEPVTREAAREGARRAFGRSADAPLGFHLRLDRADVVLSLDCDFMGEGPTQARYGYDFARRRAVRDATPQDLSRVYVLESYPTITGASADHRRAVRASAVAGLAQAVFRALRDGGEPEDPWLAAAVRDLRAAGERALVVAGTNQPAEVHALAHAATALLGGAGRTIVYTPPVEPGPLPRHAALRELVDEARAGAVEALLVLDANPVYAAPADVPVAEALARVPLTIHHGLYVDETAERCTWHVPLAHDLESWGDARTFDGTISLVQPLIEPLFVAYSPLGLLALLEGRSDPAGYETLRAAWAAQLEGEAARTGGDNDAGESAGVDGRSPAEETGGAGATAAGPAGPARPGGTGGVVRRGSEVPPASEEAWQRALQGGVVPDTALPPVSVTLDGAFVAQAAAGPAQPDVPPPLELAFRPDPAIGDGRRANNAWLMELPKPISSLSWDNAAFTSPGTAERQGWLPEQRVRLRVGDRSVEAPLWPVMDHPEDAVTVHLGYGRTRVGRVGEGAGFDAYALRTSDALWFRGDLEVEALDATWPLACVQEHHRMHGRDLARVRPVHAYRENRHVFQWAEPDTIGGEASLHPVWAYPEHAWAMAIDLTLCIGCNACVIACQAENNIPVVGREQVRLGREMHWIRVDRYSYEVGREKGVVFQPLPCMHCEKAPCEVVCPVAATVHSDDGLNDMIYNRCVGTRYCSNNCPYKVRRFNFYRFVDDQSPTLKLQRNPDVTVRQRGVMEKCTYCVQRIRAAGIAANAENRAIRDGEVITACQGACPTGAIQFGDRNDPTSIVARLQQDPRNYTLLEELNTRPRTTYLGRVVNPNRELLDEQGYPEKGPADELIEEKHETTGGGS